MQFKHPVAGIPCLIDVIGAKWHRGQGRSAPSDWDAQDHFECEFEVLDRRGYAAPWLTRKLNAQIISDIEHAIAERT